MRPLIVYIHQGHLRFSALNASPSMPPTAATTTATDASPAAGSAVRGALRQGKNSDLDRDALADDELARHVTNPRFGLVRTAGTDSQKSSLQCLCIVDVLED